MKCVLDCITFVHLLPPKLSIGPSSTSQVNRLVRGSNPRLEDPYKAQLLITPVLCLAGMDELQVTDVLRTLP